MQRTQISLTESERALLDVEAARTGRSISALIRDAVNRVYGGERSLVDDLAAIDAATGAWADRSDDLAGGGYVDQLRSGRRLAADRS
ncbi:CopG family transcriptional regulator [uncultured Jatrophihabitans sp.]|uniref:ribbon-helix-helix domain-containing protein n=1 Tax=uncultured Jatrophihabitans sp. TaxID=1610747 RepID=UPI0035CAEF98